MSSYNSKWCRLQSDDLYDPVLQKLPAPVFKTYRNLQCLATKGEPRGRLPQDIDDIAYALRMKPSQLQTQLSRLQSVGLIVLDRETNRLMPSRWDDEQGIADSDAERAKRYRDNQKNRHVTDGGRVTPSSHPREEESREEEIRAEESREDFAAHADFSAANAASEGAPSASLQAAPRGNGPAPVKANGTHGTTLPERWRPPDRFWNAGVERYGLKHMSIQTQMFRERHQRDQTTSPDWDGEWVQHMMALEQSGELRPLETAQ